MLHTKFCGNRFRRRFLKGFYHIWEHDGHLGHETSIMLINFHFLVPESFHTKFGSEWHSSLRKFGLNFCTYKALGQGQVMTLTFNTHIPS